MKRGTEYLDAYDNAKCSTTHVELACNFSIFISHIYIILYL
jgi:hypothetical protein